MALRSILFAGDPKLQNCLQYDRSHIKLHAAGRHVFKIQAALCMVDGCKIDPFELRSRRYGISTAHAVLEYKRKRALINVSYQSKPDNIVGRMTIAALDKELVTAESGRARFMITLCSRMVKMAM